MRSKVPLYPVRYLLYSDVVKSIGSALIVLATLDQKLLAPS